MRVLIQEIDRYGETPLRNDVVFINDGPCSFKQGGKLDMDLLSYVLCSTKLLGISQEEVSQFLKSFSVVVDRKGMSVLLSGEEMDYTLTDVDPLIED